MYKLQAAVGDRRYSAQTVIFMPALYASIPP